jgi:hypothetical protein
MRMRMGVLLLGAMWLTACVSQPAPAPPSAAPPPPTAYTTSGLESVIGSTAPALIALFGRPDLDAREGRARKLQYVGPICVLDAYLYPRAGGEPVVTHVDARLPDGREMDRSSCVAAFSARQQAR